MRLLCTGSCQYRIHRFVFSLARTKRFEIFSTDTHYLQKDVRILSKGSGADSGYGNLDNYEYCEKLGIDAYVKYQAWNGESSGRNPAVYESLADGSIWANERDT